jgi:hypothetical protein
MRCPSPLPPTLRLPCPSPSRGEESVWATRTWAERGLAVSRTVWVISKRYARGGPGRPSCLAHAPLISRRDGRNSGQAMVRARWMLHRRYQATALVRRRCGHSSDRTITSSRHERRGGAVAHALETITDAVALASFPHGRSLVHGSDHGSLAPLLHESPLTNWRTIRHSVSPPTPTLSLHPLTLLLCFACVLVQPKVYALASCMHTISTMCASGKAHAYGVRASLPPMRCCQQHRLLPLQEARGAGKRR